MSASNQKKIRQQEREIYRSERERQEALEAKKLRKQTIAFVVVIALCLSIFLGSFLVSPIKNVIYKNTIAVNVGDHALTATDVNYFYVDAVNSWLNQNIYYIYFGQVKIDFSTPLNEQKNTTTGQLWSDYFLDMAVKNIKSTFGLYDLAMKADHKLTEDEQKELDGMEASLKDSAKQNSFTSVKEMLQSSYGNGANLESYLAYYEICTYANSFYTAYQDSLKYESDELREYEGDESYKYNSYTYAYYLLNVSTFLPEGVTESKATAEQKKAAEKACKELADQLAAGEFATLEEFDAAIDAAIKEVKGENKTEDTNKPETQDEGTTDPTTPTDPEDPETSEDEKEEEEEKKPDLKYPSTKMDDILYSSVTALFKDWIIGKLPADSDDKTENKDEEDKPKFETRKEGDMTVIENASGTGDNKTIKGYYVVRYGSSNDNSYALADVRHILIKFQGGTTNSSGQTTYPADKKAEAKQTAEKLYNEFKNGAKVDEDTFAALATIHSDDGNKSEGGLYEGVYPGQMVTSFNDWCFDEARKAGDHGLIETEYGWHLMFYVGDNEQSYRDYMVSNDKRAEDMEKWFDDIIKNSEFEAKNMKYVKGDMILGM